MDRKTDVWPASIKLRNYKSISRGKVVIKTECLIDKCPVVSRRKNLSYRCRGQRTRLHHATKTKTKTWVKMKFGWVDFFIYPGLRKEWVITIIFCKTHNVTQRSSDGKRKSMSESLFSDPTLVFSADFIKSHIGFSFLLFFSWSSSSMLWIHHFPISWIIYLY